MAQEGILQVQLPTTSSYLRRDTNGVGAPEFFKQNQRIWGRYVSLPYRVWGEPSETLLIVFGTFVLTSKCCIHLFGIDNQNHVNEQILGCRISDTGTRCLTGIRLMHLHAVI